MELDSAQGLGALELLLVGLLIGLIVVSVVGNCLVCVAIFTDRRLRKLGNAFIVSLAIADLFVSCLVMTFALCNDLMNYWIFGEWFCDVWISFDIMCCTASILNLCAISLDRFIHIKDCLLYNQWMTRRVAISAVIIIWCISATVSFVPINLGWHKPDHFSSSPSLSHPLERPSSATPHKLNYLQALRPIENQSSPSAGQQLQETSNTNRAEDPTPTFPLADDSSGLRGGGQFNKVESNPPDGSQIGADPKRRPNRWQDPFSPVAAPAVAAASGGLGQQLPLCMLSLTPTYAIISSTISFYIPCIIMLGLYTKLFACARRHVRNIQALGKAPPPIGPQLSIDGPLLTCGGLGQPPPARGLRTWLKFSRASNDSSSTLSAPQDRPKAALGRAPEAPASLGDKPEVGAADKWIGKLTAGGAAQRLLEQPGATNELPGQEEEQYPFLGRPDCQQPRLQPEPAARQATSASPRSAKTNQSQVSVAQLQRQQQQRQQQQQQSGQLATHKAAITLGIIMGTFLFCWVPFFCLNIVKAFCVDCIPGSLFRAFTWLGYANSALNPIIYGIHNSEFRCAFNRIFFKHLNIKNSRYYLNRRFSYDLRHQANLERRAAANRKSGRQEAGAKAPLATETDKRETCNKSDTVT